MHELNLSFFPKLMSSHWVFEMDLINTICSRKSSIFRQVHFLKPGISITEKSTNKAQFLKKGFGKYDRRFFRNISWFYHYNRHWDELSFLRQSLTRVVKMFIMTKFSPIKIFGKNYDEVSLIGQEPVLGPWLEFNVIMTL